MKIVFLLYISIFEGYVLISYKIKQYLEKLGSCFLSMQY